jgi:hypothetical protein
MEDSGWGRLIGVLISPGQTFRSIAGRPTWAVPLLVIILLGGLTQWLLQSKTDQEAVLREQTEAFGMEMTQEQIDEALEKAKEPGRQAAGAVFAVFGVCLLYFLAAAIFWVFFRMFGSEIDYRTSLATTVHGLLPFGVAALLNIPLILARDSITFDDMMAGGILMSNLGFLAPEDAGMAVRGLLQSADFFSVWSIVLLVIGYRATARVSTGTTTGIVLLVWLLGVAVKVGLLALPEMLMGGGGGS